MFHYDAHLPAEEPELFRSFLEICKVLMWDVSFDKCSLPEEEKKYLLSYEYWCRQGSLVHDEIPYYILQKPMKVLMPALIQTIKRYNDRIFESKYYWRHKNRNYLRLVYDCIIPDAMITHDQILKCGYDMDKFENKKARDFYLFLMEIDKEFGK